MDKVEISVQVFVNRTFKESKLFEFNENGLDLKINRNSFGKIEICAVTKILPKRVDELLINPRTRNILREANVTFVSELAEMTEMELLKQPNCGKVTVVDARCALAKHRLKLADSKPWTGYTLEDLGLNDTVQHKLNKIGVNSTAKLVECATEPFCFADFLSSDVYHIECRLRDMRHDLPAGLAEKVDIFLNS